MEYIKINENDFDKSIESTIKTISNKRKLSFYFKKNLIKIEGNKIYLPEISTIKNRVDLKNYRGIADFIALKLKFHNKKIYNYFKPKENLYLKFYEALEETRIISLGASHGLDEASLADPDYQKSILASFLFQQNYQSLVFFLMIQHKYLMRM